MPIRSSRPRGTATSTPSRSPTNVATAARPAPGPAGDQSLSTGVTNADPNRYTYNPELRNYENLTYEDILERGRQRIAELISQGNDPEIYAASLNDPDALRAFGSYAFLQEMTREDMENLPQSAARHFLGSTWRNEYLKKDPEFTSMNDAAAKLDGSVPGLRHTVGGEEIWQQEETVRWREENNIPDPGWTIGGQSLGDWMEGTIATTPTTSLGIGGEVGDMIDTGVETLIENDIPEIAAATGLIIGGAELASPGIWGAGPSAGMVGTEGAVTSGVYGAGEVAGGTGAAGAGASAAALAAGTGIGAEVGAGAAGSAGAGAAGAGAANAIAAGTGIGAEVGAGVGAGTAAGLSDPSFWDSSFGEGVQDFGTGFLGGETDSFWGGLGALTPGLLDSWLSYEMGDQAAEDYAAAAAAANPFGPHREQYAQQLNNLYADPSSVENLPGYQFQFDQGMKALNRSSAAKGNRLGGKAMYEAQEFGQGLASQMRQQEIENLYRLSGANIAPGGTQFQANAGSQRWQGIQEGFGTLGHAIETIWGNNPSNNTGDRPASNSTQPANVQHGGVGQPIIFDPNTENRPNGNSSFGGY